MTGLDFRQVSAGADFLPLLSSSPHSTAAATLFFSLAGGLPSLPILLLPDISPCRRESTIVNHITEMSHHLDVEALLDAAAKADSPRDKKPQENGDDHPNGDRRGDKTPRDSSRDRKRRDRRSYSPRSEAEKTPRSETGSHRSRRRSRSREHSGRHSRRNRGSDRDGDYYRGGRARSRSRSPNRYYRPRDPRRDRDDDRSYGRRDDDRRGARGRSRDATPPQLTEDERDRRTVFVQQLAARLRTRELKEFFEKVGPVAEAQIVKDRVSNRSKGYAHMMSPIRQTQNIKYPY